MTIFSPIALFVFNRPKHTLQTITSLANCKNFSKHPLFIFGDGPRDEDDFEAVSQVRSIISSFYSTREFSVYYQVNNLGLANSILSGINHVFKDYNTVIVLEDDLILASSFLDFLNTALIYHSDDKNIYQVSGFAFADQSFLNRKESMLLPITTTWGWGTWKRCWINFDISCKDREMLLTDKKKRRRFNLDGVYDYASMLERQFTKESSSWGVKWYYHVFINSGLTVFPPVSLVKNNGMDGSGTNGRGFFRRYSNNIPSMPNATSFIPYLSYSDNLLCYKRIKNIIFFKNGGHIGKIIDLVKKNLSKLIIFAKNVFT